MSETRIEIVFYRYDLNPETGERDGTKIASLPWPVLPGAPTQVMTVDGHVVVADDLPELADQLAVRYGVKEKD